MSALFGHVVKQAFITFDQSNAAKFKANFNALKLLVDQLTPKDLNLDPELTNSSAFYNRPNKAPVTYLEIFEHETFTMSVFIVANQYTMPLHDHPGFGLLRVLSGTARIQSYSLVNPTDTCHLRNARQPQILHVIKEPMRSFGVDTESSILTPTKCNIHQITAVQDEPTAFFDILSPPYESHLSVDGPKKCSFFQPISFEKNNGDDSSSSSSSSASFSNCDSDEGDTNTTARQPNARLQTCNTPPHYYCDTEHYYPPECLRKYY